jgi:Sec-independent protein translocase protein TatA
VIALVIFGPDELPEIASQVGGAPRDLRRVAEGAKSERWDADQRARQQSARKAAANRALLTPSKSPHSPIDNGNEKEPE